MVKNNEKKIYKENAVFHDVLLQAVVLGIGEMFYRGYFNKACQRCYAAF